MAELTKDSTYKLPNGGRIPVIGFGVWESPAGKMTVNSVKHAFKSGYRQIDTAMIYRNEQDVGEAIRQSELNRDEIFVTTKLWNADQGYDSSLKACEKSLKKLGLDCLDLYLIHWPQEDTRHDSWTALRVLQEKGLCKNIGVSNYTIDHLTELMDDSGIVPVVNQVEFHPFLYQHDLLQFCKDHKILLQAYSPLVKAKRMTDEALISMAEKYGVTVAQILIRWCLEHGTNPLPKSNTPSRIRENIAVFDFALDPDDVNTLNNLNEDYRTAWDPSDIP